jgi:hypothetical protein
MTAEHLRLEATQEQHIPWKKWGPYLSERQWGTVHEDLIETNRRRGRAEFEYELLGTGGFDENRHFDVFVEYATGHLVPEGMLP